jgi:hypothetical protein
VCVLSLFDAVMVINGERLMPPLLPYMRHISIHLCVWDLYQTLRIILCPPHACASMPAALFP